MALTGAAEPMRATMANLAPRAPGAPDIADHMVISRITKIGDVEGGQWEKKLDSEEAVAIGPARGFFYGVFLEYGTVKMRAQPFMRPAWDQHSAKALETIGRVLWRELAAAGISQSSVGGAVSGGTGGSTL